MIIMIVIGIMLLYAGIADFRSLRISKAYIIALFAVCAVAVFVTGGQSVIAALSGTLMGICALGLSLISDGQIGKGDGFVIAAIGLVLGFRGSLIVVCIASMVMCVVAVVVLVLKKGNKKTKLPFIPALFVAYVVYIVRYIPMVGVIGI